LGWPLEWTEIIVIFVPIFLPLLKHFNIDPILWGTLVFVNLQAAFLSPPVAMSAFYLKGVSPPRHAQPDLRRHDALHAGHHPVHGNHVSVARHDAVAAELSIRELIARVFTVGRNKRSALRRSRANGAMRYAYCRLDVGHELTEDPEAGRANVLPCLPRTGADI